MELMLKPTFRKVVKNGYNININTRRKVCRARRGISTYKFVVEFVVIGIIVAIV